MAGFKPAATVKITARNRHQLEFSRVVRGRFFARRNSDSSFCQRDRTRTIGGTVADVGPLDPAAAIDNVRNGRGNSAGPMPFVSGADGADQFGVGIREESHRVQIQENMRTVLLAIARHALDKFLSFFWRVNADAENLDFSFKVSFPLVDKGRHLGPAPGSPAAPVEKNHRRRRRAENRGKFDSQTVDILKGCPGKLIADG